MGAKRVLNVGGNSKAIAIPAYFDGFEHLLLDIDPSGQPDIVADARSLQDEEPAQFDAVYCSHNLEHYYRHDAARVLRGFHHVLKPDGFAEIRVPDLEAVFKRMIEAGMDIDDVLYESPAGPISIRDTIYGFGAKIEQSGEEFFAHKTGFTPKSLSKLILSCGFAYVVRRSGRPWEVLAYAFKAYPSGEHERLLGLELGDANERPNKG